MKILAGIDIPKTAKSWVKDWLEKNFSDDFYTIDKPGTYIELKPQNLFELELITNYFDTYPTLYTELDISIKPGGAKT